MDPVESPSLSYFSMLPEVLKKRIYMDVAKNNAAHLICVSKLFSTDEKKLIDENIVSQLTELNSFCELKLKERDKKKALSGLTARLAKKILALYDRISFIKKTQIYSQIFSLSTLCNEVFDHFVINDKLCPFIFKEMKNTPNLDKFTPQLILCEFKKINLVFDEIKDDKLKSCIKTKKANQAIFRQSQTDKDAITLEIINYNQKTKEIKVDNIRIDQEKLDALGINTFSQVYHEAFRKTNEGLFQGNIIPSKERTPMIIHKSR